MSSKQLIIGGIAVIGIISLSYLIKKLREYKKLKTEFTNIASQQALSGNCNREKPDEQDEEEFYKWKAWQSVKGTSQIQAMQNYINIGKEMLKGANPHDQRIQGGVFSKMVEEWEDELDQDNPVFIQAREGDLDAAKIQDINQKNEEGVTILHHAVDAQQTQLVEALLQRNDIDLNAQDISGETPLHYASKLPDLEIYEILLKDPRIKVNIEDEDGRTADYYAKAR